MEPNCRFTLFTFPQYFDGNILKLNIVVLPRNQNPLMPAIEGEPPLPDAPPFAEANFSFEAKIISGLSLGLPTYTSTLPPVPLVIVKAPNVKPLFEALGNQFKIKNKGIQNKNINITNLIINGVPEKAPEPVKKQLSVKKYLPISYRKSFNFISPRTENAVTDDSYHCAIRDAKFNPGFIKSLDEISWGRVFAYAMRQPLLAKSLGIIYQTQISIDNSFFPKGGWLYVDLGVEGDYKEQQNIDDTFIKIYAARIPTLEVGNKRNVFSAIQFPVLKAPSPGNYDKIFSEAADYDDGFAKIVHASQPVSNNLLLEESDGFHPIKDVGIRLGWDDEQILIWHMRQMMEDESIGPKTRIDAPMGVFGYRVDVREKMPSLGKWQSLNSVTSKKELKISDPVTMNTITLGNFDNELTYQVYPSQIDGDLTKNFWLPIYFANWNGKSMVLPDDEGIAIYQNDKQVGAPDNNLNKLYKTALINTLLQYGKIYEFRVRMGDLSGGGPDINSVPINETQSQIATCHFRRFVAPSTVRIENLPANDDSKYFEHTKLTIRRPLLGYPAVVFTAKYANAVDLLKQASMNMVGKEAFGIADPDVESVEITVEVQALKMDNLLSVSGKEAYIKLYSTTRNFPTVSPVLEDSLDVPLEYRDCKVLNFGDPGDLGDLGVTQSDLDSMDKLILPTARTIRLTIRAVCEEKENYYGLESHDPHHNNHNTRFGRTTQFLLYKESSDENNLFVNMSIGKKIQGIYLQADPPLVYDGNPTSVFLGKEVEKPADIIQRLSQQLGLESSGLTLIGKKGERIQFGCSNRIRHTLSPDNSSITFSSKGDLINHWLCCITLEIDRDWTWDALDDVSFVIQRKKWFREDDLESEAETLDVGDIEIKRTVPFNALLKPERGRTTLIFIDAVEPKNALMQSPPNDNDPRFPDLIELQYTVKTNFKTNHALQKDSDISLPLELPITIPPSQMPKIVSAGIALSPYSRNEKYSATEPRRRFLWIEFEEPVKDPKDSYFARQLGYAPDQLISNNHPDLLNAPEEPALPIDPEYIRIVTPNQSNDDAGLDAMQLMEKATDSDKHYLLPLPFGLHSESPEMFGFFKYEFRVGHCRYSDDSTNHKKDESVWTTAQARFGRPLTVAGIQHPAPTLVCTANRDEEKVYITAPYALAMHKGKNVTANPPRTELWCLLYAQVKQADNQGYRNILLDDKKLDFSVKVEHDKNVDWSINYDYVQRDLLKRAAILNSKDEIDYVKLRHMYKLVDNSTVNKDATKYGTVIWTNDEINQILSLYGLPIDSPLSILCVEILPHITNIYDHINDLDRSELQEKLRSILQEQGFPTASQIKERIQSNKKNAEAIILTSDRPLSNNLGHYRILRTSPLIEVPFVCCTGCE